MRRGGGRAPPRVTTAGPAAPTSTVFWGWWTCPFPFRSAVSARSAGGVRPGQQGWPPRQSAVGHVPALPRREAADLGRGRVPVARVGVGVQEGQVRVGRLRPVGEVVAEDRQVLRR